MIPPPSRALEHRVRAANSRPPAPDRDYVLYWMVANRRVRSNHALERAAAWSRTTGKPLLVLEALRIDYPWASERLHRFVLDGMADVAAALSRTMGVRHHAYVEPRSGAGRGLLAALASRAVVVVTDDAPVFFLPRAVDAAARRLDVLVEAVDSVGLVPLALAGRSFSRAHDFRRFVQRNARDLLDRFPAERPLRRLGSRQVPRMPGEVTRRWPSTGETALRGARLLASLDVDREVVAVSLRGGPQAAKQRLGRFVARSLEGYAESRRSLDADATSGLSPYLHFGHLSTFDVLRAIAAAEDWGPEDLARDSVGSREGFWGASPGAEAYLDQLVVWRELGFNAAHRDPSCHRFESLPEWALRTLEAHRRDPRETTYSHADLEAARTHDAVWNAAQNELRVTGRMNGYLRMVWGKKVVEWCRSPRRALEILLAINDRWALDGRDPNSVSGITWCFGRYDRPWPEGPVLGRIRRMTTDGARRKLRLGGYLARYAPDHRAGAPSRGAEGGT